MRVVGDPRMPRQAVLTLCNHGKCLAYFQPTEQDVEMWGGPNKSPTLAMSFHLPEPAEEQEYVTGANTLRSQVRLGSPRLPEGRAPTRQPKVFASVEIGIEVDRCTGRVPSTAQVVQKAGNIDLPPIKVPHGETIMASGNRQWQQPPIRQDRTRHSPVGAVESLPRQNDLPESCGSCGLRLRPRRA